MNCLNLDNADVQQWIQQESLEKVYQVYVDNNYILPDYTIWKQFNNDVSMSEIETRLDAILPLSKFSIDKLSKLMNSLPISTQAAYLQNVIYLSENPKLVDVYEEGFHAIFDTLVSESEKKQLLEAAQSMLAKKLKKDGKTINQYVKEIAEKYPETYSTMSQKQKLERVFEEELAKMYVDSLQYKNPYGAEKQLELSLIPYVGASVAKTVASILSKAFNVLKSIYKMFTDNRDTISLFFKQINDGKYKNSIVSLNENSTIPTTRLLELVGEEKYNKLLKKDLTIKKLFSSEETQKVIRNVGSIFFQLQNEQIKNSFNERLDESVYQYFVNDDDIDNIFNDDRTLINEKNQEAISALKEDISSYIKDFNSLVDFDSEVVESEEETQNEFKYIDTSADERNPYENSYSRQLKLRIAKAGKIKDTSFKTVTIDGKQVELTFIEAVDVYKTYSALARALSNTDNGEQRWKKLMAFSNLETNSDTKAFVNQLIYDMFKTKFPKGTNYYTVITESINNITNRKPGFIIFPTDKEISEGVETIGTNNAVIVNSIVKGFDLWKRTNYVMTYDAVKKTAKLYDANSNNVQSVQYNTWLNTIMSLDVSKTNDIPLFLTIGDKDSDQYARDIKDSFEKRGILLSKDYISYSIAKYKISEGKRNTLTKTEENLIDNFNLPDDLLLDTKTSNNVANINNAFKDFTLQKITGVDGKGGIEGRLKTIAEGNSYFDESIPDGTYKTADGKTKYNFQYKTFHLQRIDEILKGKGELANTIPGQDFINPEFIKDNYILQKLKTPEWQRLINNRTIFSFTADGLRQQDTLANGKKEDSDGVVAGDMSNRDFMLYLLNSAVGISEKANEVKTVPIYFGNYEASKTYEFITLPFIKDLIDNNGMFTNAGAELIETEIKKEFNRIQKEAKNVELENTYTKYNTGKTVLVNGVKIPYKLNDEGFKVIDFSNYRALAFSDYVKGLIGNDYLTLPKVLEDRINTELNSGNDNIVIDDINTENSLLAKALFSEYNDKGVIDSIKKSIDNLNTITVNKLKSTGAVELLDNKYSQAVTNLGFVSKNIDVNVKKVATNNLLNTMFINQLMQGDQALLYKNDGVDMFKRFKMRNAAIVSYETDTIAPELGITETWKELPYIVHSEIQAKSGIDKSDIDQADAQNYGTLKYFRHAQYAMGRLNADLANLYDMIEQGEDTTSIEDKIFDMELYTPILKTVGFDGSNGIKKSDFMLSKRLTSTFKSITEAEAKKHGELVNGRWKPINGAKIETVKWSDGSYYEVVPRPEKQLLHDRRKVMEGWRFSNGEWEYTGEEIMLSMPISASKLLNRNTLSGHDLKAVTTKNINKIDLRYYGLQVETAHPHDKIPDPTQYLEIALNELKNEDGTKFNIDGKEVNTDELVNMYQDALYQRDDIRFNELYNEIFETDEEGKITFKKEDFKAIFVRSLEVSGNEKQVIELAQLGQFNNPLIRDKFIAQIFSYFTKDGLSQKRKGDAAPHFSSYGMKLIKKSVKHIVDGKEHWSWETLATDSEEYKKAILSHKTEALQDLSSYDFYPDVDNKPHTRYTENRLQDAIESLGEGKYFIDELRHLKPRIENNKITGYFTEAVLSKYEREQARIYDGQRYMFGVRIPSQDKHSGVNIEWVDMLPAHYGSAIAVAKEIVQLSGSDFDIDKLYISKPDGYYTKDGFKQYDNSYEDYVKYQKKNKQEPLSETEFNKVFKGKYSNRGYINNLLLQANQQGLANNQTLDGKISDTPASMTYMDKGVLKENVLENGEYLLSKDGKSFVGSSKSSYNVHSFMGHVNMHNNVNTGKKNIGADVNWMLLDIVLNRIGAEINPNNSVTIGDETYNSLELAIKNNKYLRVFDVLSTLTSSATDEAKEQLNARYGFNIDALNAVIPLVAMGGNLSLGIALVNQPIIKDFLARKAIKNNAVLTFDEKKEKYKRDNDLIKDLTGLEYEELMKLSGTYSVEDLAKGLRGTTTNDIKNLVLRDYIKLTEITEYGANLIAAIKLKKGFGSDIYSFDGLLEKLNNLDVFKSDEDAPSRPINIRESLKVSKENKAKEIFGKLDIVSKLQGGLPKIINLKKEIFEKLRESVKQETVFLNRTAQQELNNELESFIYSQLLIKDLQNIKEESYDKLILNYLNRELITENADNNIGDIFIKFKTAADKIPQLVDNALLKKLQINKRNGVVSLTLNQLVKLNDTEMSELQDSFIYLTNFIESLEGSISPLEFTKVLQALFIVKDGMQFKYDGISKIFPATVFNRFGKILEDVSESKLNPMSIEEMDEFISRYMTSVKHKASVTTVQVKEDTKGIIVKDNTVTLERNNKDKNYKLPTNDNNQYYNYVNFNIDKVSNLYYKTSMDENSVVYTKINTTGNSNITTMGIPVNKLVFGQTEIQIQKVDELNVNLVKGKKLIDNEDISNFNKFISNKDYLPTTFFTGKTRLSEFYNNVTGRNEVMPNNYLWSLNIDKLYDLVNQETGEVSVENVDLKTGFQYIKSSQTESTAVNVEQSSMVNTKPEQQSDTTLDNINCKE